MLVTNILGIFFSGLWSTLGPHSHVRVVGLWLSRLHSTPEGASDVSQMLATNSLHDGFKSLWPAARKNSSSFLQSKKMLHCEISRHIMIFTLLIRVLTYTFKRYSASHTLKTATYFNYHLFISLVIIYLSCWLSFFGKLSKKEDKINEITIFQETIKQWWKMIIKW